ncbi:MAG: aminotransferase class III-fold pyridoxal phosphate-dependent enzyme [Acidobacteria bacterium]|nr:aminotransferase class III-fold pyridoxal phosphate-dependent enzyme [Acidobacteriota bacterium]
MTDAGDKEFIDLVSSWGPMILGHGNERVVEAIRETALSGTSFGANNEKEILLYY